AAGGAEPVGRARSASGGRAPRAVGRGPGASRRGARRALGSRGGSRPSQRGAGPVPSRRRRGGPARTSERIGSGLGDGPLPGSGRSAPARGRRGSAAVGLRSPGQRGTG